MDNYINIQFLTSTHTYIYIYIHIHIYAPNKYTLPGLPLIGSRGRRIADAPASPDGNQEHREDLGGWKDPGWLQGWRWAPWVAWDSATGGVEETWDWPRCVQTCEGLHMGFSQKLCWCFQNLCIYILRASVFNGSNSSSSTSDFFLATVYHQSNCSKHTYI